MPPTIMGSSDLGSTRAETDTSLTSEREKADRELCARVAVADDDADDVLRIARERADRLLDAARVAADARLPLVEQTKATVALLLGERDEEDQAVASERKTADEVLNRGRSERRDKILELLSLERQTTDLHLALERRFSDRAVASRDQFFAQVSHDLRGLTGAQKIYLSLLAKQVGDDDRGRALAPHLTALVSIDAQIDRLLNDLIDVVAIDAGKLAVTLKRKSAAELVSTTTTIFAPLAKERDQSLTVAPAFVDLNVKADGARTSQVLGNLLSNAIKFTPRKGKIRVGFEAIADDVVFFVADTGPGVPAELAAQIFERFVGSANSQGGLGLGLFIAAQLVNAQGGRLWLDPNPTEGSVFRFSLKRARSRSR